MAVRERIDRRTALTRSYRTMRDFTYEGKKFAKGDDFPIDRLSLHHVSTLHGSRYIELVPQEAAAPEATEPPPRVILAQVGGSYFEVRAAWLDRPLRIRGRDAAEAKAEEIDKEGPPLGFIEGGTEVTIEEQAGGWYVLNAPWMEQPEKVQGRLAAEERQLAIHDEGEPEKHHGVLLKDVGNGWWDVKADWEPTTEKVQGADAARARAAELRAAGKPEVEPLKVGDAVQVAGDGDPVQGVITAIDGETAKLQVGEGETAKVVDAPLAALTVVEPPKPAEKTDEQPGQSEATMIGGGGETAPQPPPPAAGTE